MKKLSITKEQFEKSKYFTSKYGKLAFVSESGKIFKTNKGKILKFAKESRRELEPTNGRASFGRKAYVEDDGDGFTLLSYDTPVARIERCEGGNGQDFSLLNDYLSTTTLTHIHAFLQTYGLKDIPTKQLKELDVGKTVHLDDSNKELLDWWNKRKSGLAESKKLVKEGAGAGYTVTIKDLKFGKILDKKITNVEDDPFGCYECKVEILPGEYEISAEDYYNDFFWQDHEFGATPKAQIDGGVATVVYSKQWEDDEQAEQDLREQVENIELDITFDYGHGWVHVDLPREKIVADHVNVKNSEYYAGILDIELNAPDLADVVNYGFQSIYDRDEDEGGEEEEVDESKLAKETSDDLTLDEIYKAVKEEYGGKLFSDNFLKLNIEHVSGQVLCIFELDKPEDMGANDGDEWWEDKKDSAILFYDELVKFLVDKFGEKFRFTDPRVSDEYADKSDPKGAFEIFIDDDDASLPIITIDEVADGWYDK
jgi:hypothetical protein